MEDIEVYLLPQGDPGTGFRTKNKPGEISRRVLIDRGDSLIARATMVGITHGLLNSSEEDPATLLIFEFRFVSSKSSRRFIRASITLTFEDAKKDPRLDPEVYKIAPEGSFTLNKTVTVKTIKQSGKAGLNAGIPTVGGSAGYAWEMQETKSHEHSTRLTGTKKLFREYGDDNAVVWSLEENQDKKDGIPSFFRTAVLLRRQDDVPFSFTIKVRTDVDFISEIKTLFGMEKKDEVDPVEIDPDVDVKRVGTLDPKEVDLTNMAALNLTEQADVVIATILDTAS